MSADFTVTAYREMLGLVVDRGYLFATYQRPPSPPHVLWRHDIDLSVHRARHLAEIEAEHAVHATYFVNPHSSFYNALEPEILRLLRGIRALGHDIGLHFDAEAYPQENWTRECLETKLRFERTLLGEALACPIEAFSFHNPEVGNLLAFDEDRIAGMANAYSARLRRDYVYASDSSGHWRFKSIPEIIREGHPRMHLLTHPGWWTPEPLTAYERVERCVIGRACKVLQSNDELLARLGRSYPGKPGGRPDLA
jgi:hypothetical protein